MCNFIEANGEQCKLALNNDQCGKHQIIAAEENNVQVSIVEEMPPQVGTPAIAEVVDTQAPSVIKPVEVSKGSKVPELDQSIDEPVIAEEVVYKEDQSSDLESYNSIDVLVECYSFNLNEKDDGVESSEAIDAWRSFAKDIDCHYVINSDPE